MIEAQSIISIISLFHFQGLLSRGQMLKISIKKLLCAPLIAHRTITK